MIAIFEFLWNSDIARLIGGALAALLAFWGYGAAKERKGKLAERERAAEAKAKAEAKGDAAVVESRRDGLTWQERLKRNGDKK